MWKLTLVKPTSGKYIIIKWELYLFLRRGFMDTILYNGNIITMDSNSPKSEALFIRGNKFFKVGKTKIYYL
jgi:hypothetical protein